MNRKHCLLWYSQRASLHTKTQNNVFIHRATAIARICHTYTHKHIIGTHPAVRIPIIVLNMHERRYIRHFASTTDRWITWMAALIERLTHMLTTILLSIFVCVMVSLKILFPKRAHTHTNKINTRVPHSYSHWLD